MCLITTWFLSLLLKIKLKNFIGCMTKIMFLFFYFFFFKKMRRVICLCVYMKQYFDLYEIFKGLCFKVSVSSELLLQPRAFQIYLLKAFSKFFKIILFLISCFNRFSLCFFFIVVFTHIKET